MTQQYKKILLIKSFIYKINTQYTRNKLENHKH